MATTQSDTAAPGVQVIVREDKPRPVADSDYYLAVGSTRIDGHRFVYGAQLPAEAGKKLYDDGMAIKGEENLRFENGTRKPPPFLDRTPQTAPHDTGARPPGSEGTNEAAQAVGVIDGKGVHHEQTSQPLADSQSGNRTEHNEQTRKPSRARS